MSCYLKQVYNREYAILRCNPCFRFHLSITGIVPCSQSGGSSPRLVMVTQNVQFISKRSWTMKYMLPTSCKLLPRYKQKFVVYSFNKLNSIECLGGRRQWLPQPGVPGVHHQCGECCGLSPHLPLGAPGHQGAWEQQDRGLCGQHCGSGRGQGSGQAYQIHPGHKVRTSMRCYNLEFKLYDTICFRYSNYAAYFKLDSITGRLSVRRNLQELETELGPGVPLLLRIIAQVQRVFIHPIPLLTEGSLYRRWRMPNQ